MILTCQLCQNRFFGSFLFRHGLRNLFMFEKFVDQMDPTRWNWCLSKKFRWRVTPLWAPRDSRTTSTAFPWALCRFNAGSTNANHTEPCGSCDSFRQIQLLHHNWWFNWWFNCCGFFSRLRISMNLPWIYHDLPTMIYHGRMKIGKMLRALFQSGDFFDLFTLQPARRKDVYKLTVFSDWGFWRAWKVFHKHTIDGYLKLGKPPTGGYISG